MRRAYVDGLLIGAGGGFLLILLVVSVVSSLR